MQLTFISSKDTEKEHVMQTRSNNIKFRSFNDVNEVVDELYDSLRSKYQGKLET